MEDELRMKRKLSPTSNGFGIFFWVVYFISIIAIMIVSTITTKGVRIILSIPLFLLMISITGHFWARSDYPELILKGTQR